MYKLLQGCSDFSKILQRLVIFAMESHIITRIATAVSLCVRRRLYELLVSLVSWALRGPSYTTLLPIGIYGPTCFTAPCASKPQNMT